MSGSQSSGLVMGANESVGMSEAELVRRTIDTTPAFDPFAGDPLIVEKFGDHRDAAVNRAALRSARSVEVPLEALPDGDDDDWLGIAVVPAGVVHVEPVTWLWPNWIPRGKLVLLDGDPDVGKSSLTVDFVARVSTGRDWPDGSPSRGPEHCLLVSAEDDTADTVAPRLLAAGADLDRVSFLGTNWGLPDNLDALERTIVETGAALLVIDPLVAFLDVGVNSWSDQSVRRAVSPLADLAHRTGVTVICTRHLIKRAADGKAIHGGGASIGLIGQARLGLVAARHPDDEDRRVLAVTKSNLAPRQGSLEYRLEGTQVEDPATRLPLTDPDTLAPVTYPRVEWLGASSLCADELVAAGSNDRGGSALGEAVEFLEGFLASGPVEGGAVKEAAAASGIAARTLRRARTKIGVTTRPGDFHGPWLWSLPEPDSDRGNNNDPQ